MALKISPRSTLDSLVKGEEISYELGLTGELDTNTVKTYTYTVLDSSGEDVTDSFGGGSILADSVITFGVKAYDIGTYTLRFIVTCNETLPDGVTEYEFYVRLTVVIN